MTAQNSGQYDAVIIGAGIGGLVCGCYLAKAGMKVLIAEQHFKPGGYCTSFTRKGFTFDAAAHSFGGCRDGGIIDKILNDLNLRSRIRIDRYDPSDIIIAPDFTFSFWADQHRTVQELQNAFPSEAKGIRDFFRFLSHHTPPEYAALRRKTFKDLLDQFLTEEKLKAVLSLPLLGNAALPPSLLSAFSGVKVYTEFLLDGGYYPEGGMQTLPDLLAEKFRELGGELFLSCAVEKIQVADNSVSGVVLKKRGFLSSRYVISNCDARQTFLQLLERPMLDETFLAKLDAMTPSQSIFVLYLGIDAFFSALPKPGSNVWFLSHYGIEDLYRSTTSKCLIDKPEYFMVRVSPDCKSVLAFVNAPFRDYEFWKKHKEQYMESFICQIESSVIAGLSDHIVYREAASPLTMCRYTHNYKGAAYGWAAVPSQFADPEFRKPSSIKHLYLAGHWTTYAQGIPGVTYMGRDTAMVIAKREKM